MANKPNKLAFLTQVAPSGYVPGLGRGASGFTTRSDIGPAREGPSAEVIAEAQARRGEEIEPDAEQFQDPDNETGLFAGMVYEQDDEEADRIYEAVDAKMDERRKIRREAREAMEMAVMRAERPKIQAQFADLKRGLSEVSDSEWENLPEVNNLTGKRRKLNPREGKTYVVPDSILVGDRDRGGIENSLDPRQQQLNGFQTPADGMADIVGISQARDKVLSLKLDQVSSASASSGTSTSIDPKGYLTGLDSMHVKSESEIGDIKRARQLFDSLVKSNPKHAPGWIAAACTEEAAGRMVSARKLIRMGCEQCPKSEDVWLEAARLHNNDDAKVILAQAVQHVDQSVKIWLTAADLEGDPKAKKRVLRKAVEHIPKSVRLWKETVNLESDPAEARIILARAVEVIPTSVELWLALARLEEPTAARAVLNKARKEIPTSHEIWIAAGRLIEQELSSPTNNKSAAERQKDLETIDKTIKAGVNSLRKNQVLLNRDQWIKEAERCEEEGSPRTCEAIIKATIAMDVEEEDRYDTWVADSEASLARGKVGTARAIMAVALKEFPDRKSLWRTAADLERSYGTRESLQALLTEAVKACPYAEVLWLMLAKEKWLSGDVDAARGVLHEAFNANSESEQIWLAAVKLEAENGEYEAARELLKRAREKADTERTWMKSIVFERQQGNLELALELLDTALSKYPKFPKLHMIKGQILESQSKFQPARLAYAAGIKSCPKEVTLWILASRLEERDGKRIMARSLLNKAKIANPKDERLWMESVKVEERDGAAAQAKAMLARALQDCPTSGILWSMSIMSEPRPTRRTRSTDAIKKAGGDDPYIMATVARLFWADRKLDKARQWLSRAASTQTGKDLGDIWGWWYKFEQEHGTPEQRQYVISQCVAAEPHHGVVWPAIAKDLANSGRSIPEILQLVANALE